MSDKHKEWSDAVVIIAVLVFLGWCVWLLAQQGDEMKTWKYNLIRFIANGEPVLLNWFMSLPEKQGYVAYIPSDSERLTPKEAAKKAVLVPLKNMVQPQPRLGWDI